MSKRKQLALVVALLGALSCQKSTPAAAPPPQPVTMITLDQIQARLAEDKAAGRIAVLHMWATWCGPCVEEFPELAKFQRDLLTNDKTVDFFAVSVDDPGNKDDVVKFVADSGARFPVFIADAPDQEAFARGINPAWPSVLPTTFFYGTDGATKDIVLGEIESAAEFRKKIEATKK